MGERAARTHLAVEVDVELRGRGLLVAVQPEDLQPCWVSARGLALRALAARGMLLRGSREPGGSVARGGGGAPRFGGGALWAPGEPGPVPRPVRLHPIAPPESPGPGDRRTWNMMRCVRFAKIARELVGRFFLLPRSSWASDRAGGSHIRGATRRAPGAAAEARTCRRRAAGRGGGGEPGCPAGGEAL